MGYVSQMCAVLFGSGTKVVIIVIYNVYAGYVSSRQVHVRFTLYLLSHVAHKNIGAHDENISYIYA